MNFFEFIIELVRINPFMYFVGCATIYFIIKIIVENIRRSIE